MNNEKNPNMEAKELVYPLIHNDESGVPIKSGMVFYDKKLDFRKELPQFDPMTAMIENINWNNILCEDYSACYPEDYLNKVFRKTNAMNEKIDIHVGTDTNLMKKTDNDAKDIKEEVEAKPYEIMNQLLSKKKIITINNTFYVYSGISYVPQTHIDIARLTLNECRELLKTKSSSFIDGVVNLLLKEPKICVSEMEISHKFLAFKNCILDLENKTILKHSSDYITLYEINANYICNNATWIDKYII